MRLNTNNFCSSRYCKKRILIRLKIRHCYDLKDDFNTFEDTSGGRRVAQHSLNDGTDLVYGLAEHIDGALQRAVGLGLLALVVLEVVARELEVARLPLLDHSRRLLLQVAIIDDQGGTEY